MNTKKTVAAITSKFKSDVSIELNVMCSSSEQRERDLTNRFLQISLLVHQSFDFLCNSFACRKKMERRKKYVIVKNRYFFSFSPCHFCSYNSVHKEVRKSFLRKKWQRRKFSLPFFYSRSHRR
jgi:hypothetical protein